MFMPYYSQATLGTVEYPGMSKTLEKAESRFTLHVEPGSFRGAEMIGLLGENGCGKHGRLTQNQNARLVFWGTWSEKAMHAHSCLAR